MPSLDHEAPLVVLREEPALVPALLREALGLELPSFESADVIDADLSQPLPTEFRADLVVCLRDASPARAPVMGIVVEVQRARDDSKRRTWPVYVAALHARLRCPTALVVVTTDDAVASWAALPIATLQPGSPFVPLVLAPRQVPRLSLERARVEPWLAVLSALAHGNRPDGTSATLVALEAITGLSDEHAILCSDLIYASLNDAARSALEDDMLAGKYELRSEFARRHHAEGREEGRIHESRELLVAIATRRLGALDEEVRQRVAACADSQRLHDLVVDVGAAPDRATIERLLAGI